MDENMIQIEGNKVPWPIDGGKHVTPIQRITAKKNYASSMQSHKMGATAAINDLYFHLGLGDESEGRIAVYQDPFYGFLKQKVEGTADRYTRKFIGLYTVGPDKGDKPTMGYDRPEIKDSLISMEGLDHSVKGVGFDYPWAWMRYDASAESLCVDKGDAGIEKALEIGACGSAKTEAEIQAMLDAELKPAYNAVYLSHPLIIGLSADDFELMMADPETFARRVSPDGRPYQHFEFYLDGEYTLYGFCRRSMAYEPTGVNLLDQSGLTEADLADLTADARCELFRSKRLARFRAEVPKYFKVDSLLFTRVSYLIIGAKDNDKKNTYWRKLLKLILGGRWEPWHDDLDTIGDVENQGLAIIPYWVLNHDFTDSTQTAYVFKGEDSYLWYTLDIAYRDELKVMGRRVLQAMCDLSDTGATTLDKLMGFFDKYFWDKAQKYFTRTAYNADAEAAYEDAWPHYTDGSYMVDTHPLAQSLGDHYEAEREWVHKRMIFMSSYFGFGPFANYNDACLGVISFRTQLAQSFSLTPAIALYPAVISGQGAVIAAQQRVMPGEAVTLPQAGGTNTNVYIMAADWLSDIGDLCGLQVDAAANAVLNITSRRLRRLKVGDETADLVTSNVGGISLGACPSLETIDARNLASLSGVHNLLLCPRLHTALLEGTDLRSVPIAAGAKIETLHLPDSLTTLSLVNLRMLTDLSLGSLANVESVRLENTPAADALDILRTIYNADDSRLTGIRVLGLSGDCTTADVEMLAHFAQDLDKDGNAHQYNAINEDGSVSEGSIPFIEGTLHCTGGIYADSMAFIRESFPNLSITADKEYFRFKDPEVNRVITNIIGDGAGATMAQIKATTSMNNCFNGNTLIKTFDELTMFDNLTSLYSTSSWGGSYYFHGCTSLESVGTDNLTSIGENSFSGCVSLTSVNLDKVKTIGAEAFMNCTSLGGVLSLPSLTSIGLSAFRATAIEEVASLGSITSLPGYGNWGARSPFYECSKLSKVVLPDSLTSIGDSPFQGCPLSVLISHAITPPTAAGSILPNGLAIIFVPDDSVEAYKTASGWTNYASRIYPLSDYQAITPPSND